MYCSGLVTRQAPPQDTVLITGEGSDYKLTFQEGDYVYINKGEGQGVHVGDEFSIIRPVDEPTRTPWFNQQFSIMRALGTLWEDEGRVKVVVVHPNIRSHRSIIPAGIYSEAISSAVHSAASPPLKDGS